MSLEGKSGDENFALMSDQEKKNYILNLIDSADEIRDVDIILAENKFNLNRGIYSKEEVGYVEDLISRKKHNIEINSGREEYRDLTTNLLEDFERRDSMTQSDFNFLMQVFDYNSSAFTEDEIIELSDRIGQLEKKIK